MAKQRPARGQLEVPGEYLRAGSNAAAACELGIRVKTVRQHRAVRSRRTRCLNMAWAAY